MRERVDRERIRGFFVALAKRFRHPARIYLVGGTSVVFEGFRPQTLDIDLVLEVASEHHGELVRTIRELKDELRTNVEETSPADFIPLPRGYRKRHGFIERLGRIDLFHFDLVSTALAKIERGRRQDLEDVLTLLEARKLDWEALAAGYREILPRMGAASLKQDPRVLRDHFEVLERMRRERGP